MSNAQGQEQPMWTDMTLVDFGGEAEAVQGSLFPEPDGCGTLDLFDTGAE